MFQKSFRGILRKTNVTSEITILIVFKFFRGTFENERNSEVTINVFFLVPMSVQ
jgi:hypothetical protein